MAGGTLFQPTTGMSSGPEAVPRRTLVRATSSTEMGDHNPRRPSSSCALAAIPMCSPCSGDSPTKMRLQNRTNSRLPLGREASWLFPLKILAVKALGSRRNSFCARAYSARRFVLLVTDRVPTRSRAGGRRFPRFARRTSRSQASMASETFSPSSARHAMSQSRAPSYPVCVQSTPPTRSSRADRISPI
jgi:hypothetical protein